MIAVALLRPQAAPALPPDPDAPRGLRSRAGWPRCWSRRSLLILAVLGSILGGVATPTEAASIGAVGAILLAMRKAGLHGLMMPVVEKTTQITAMIFLILIGATMFSLVFRALGGDVMVERALTDLPGGVNGALLAVMLAMFLLGFVMDAFEIIFVVVPIVAPALLKMPGVDPVWLGIMMAVNLQTSYMHPPLGPTLFFLRGVAPPEITTRHIYVGIIPVRADPDFRAGSTVVRPGACDAAAACALWTMRPASAWRRPETLDGDPEPDRAREHERQQNGGGAHVLDAFDHQIMVERDAVAQFFDCGVEQFDNEDEDQRADQRQAPASVCGQEEGERYSDRQRRQLLAERLLRSRRGDEAVPAIDGRLPKPFHAIRPNREPARRKLRGRIWPVYSTPWRGLCIRALHESRRDVQPARPRGAGDRRLERAGHAIRQGARR